MTDEDLLHSFIGSMKLRRADSTIKRYGDILVKFMAFASEGVKGVRNATKEEIMLFVCAPKLSSRTWVQYFSVLKHFYTWMHDRDVIIHNPFDKLKYPKTPKLLPKNIMSTKETEKLLAQIPANSENPLVYRDRTILELLYSCSLRRSEVTALDVSDFDADARSLRIDAGKTRRGRIVPVGQFAGELLSKYIAEYRQKPESKALFQNYRGERLSAKYITTCVRKLRQKSEIRTKASSHSFRKSSATHMLKNGAPLASVQALLGHAVISSTEVYTKVYSKDLFRIHRAHHPREKQKNQVLPQLEVPVLLFRRKTKK
ncbi:MAG: tyrosine-type recombinase/integrase [Planctomycetes bacterium]|nr:tyrosine-type recombinase/integrase [Planctomycetota bacterium]